MPTKSVMDLGIASFHLIEHVLSQLFYFDFNLCKPYLVPLSYPSPQNGYFILICKLGEFTDPTLRGLDLSCPFRLK